MHSSTGRIACPWPERKGDLLTPVLRIGFVPLGRPTFDTALAAEVTSEMRQALMAAGCE